MKKFTPDEQAEYLAQRNRKLLSSSVVFLNSSSEILILETTYKEHWELPGGGIEKDESPREAAIREVKEEIGLTCLSLELVFVDYRHYQGTREEMIHFVFYGGILSENDIGNFRLQSDEIKEYKFSNLENLQDLVGTGIGARLRRAIEAIKKRKCGYFDIK